MGATSNALEEPFVIGVRPKRTALPSGEVELNGATIGISEGIGVINAIRALFGENRRKAFFYEPVLGRRSTSAPNSFGSKEPFKATAAQGASR